MAQGLLFALKRTHVENWKNFALIETGQAKQFGESFENAENAIGKQRIKKFHYLEKLSEEKPFKTVMLKM